MSSGNPAAPPDAPAPSSRIETRRAHVPWSWTAWLALPWATLHFLEQCCGAPLMFTLRKFISDPTWLAFMASLNTAFTFTIGAAASYMSDRIWTPWGRRRPFLVLGWGGAVLALLLIPLAGNMWSLVALILLLHFCQDIAKPYEPLYNEVVPPAQRGRAGIVRTIVVGLTGLVFNAVLLAGFDREYEWAVFGGLRLSGDKVLFWSGAVLVATAALVIGFRVRETPPAQVVRERFSPGRFLRDVFGDRDSRRLYLLFACPFLSGMSFATFVPLFQTEQLGFTKTEVGYAAAIALLTSLVCFVPLAGWLADRVSRLRLFQIGLVGPPLVNLVLFLVVRQRTAPLEFVVLVSFSIAAAGFLALLYVAWGPLLYDYVSPERLGTTAAGFSIVGGATSFLLANAAGHWVELWTALEGRMPEGRYDYSSVYVFQVLCAAAALGITVAFGRAVARGDVAPAGSRRGEVYPVN